MNECLDVAALAVEIDPWTLSNTNTHTHRFTPHPPQNHTYTRRKVQPTDRKLEEETNKRRYRERGLQQSKEKKTHKAS